VFWTVKKKTVGLPMFVAMLSAKDSSLYRVSILPEQLKPMVKLFILLTQNKYVKIIHVFRNFHRLLHLLFEFSIQ
jgi:hypothetical protein